MEYQVISLWHKLNYTLYIDIIIMIYVFFPCPVIHTILYVHDERDKMSGTRKLFFRRQSLGLITLEI